MEKLQRMFKAVMFYKIKNNISIEELDSNFDHKPYKNYVDVLFDYIDKTYFDDDIFLRCVRQSLEIQNMPADLNDYVRETIKHVEDNFSLNVMEDYLIVPLKGARISENIEFGRFFFIKEDFEAKMVEQLHQLTNIDKTTIIDSINHTKKSRSPYFMSNVLMGVKIKNNQSYIHRNMEVITEYLVHCLKILSKSYDNQEVTPVINPHKFVEHVAIISQKNWRTTHKHIKKEILITSFSLDFLNQEKYKSSFETLYNMKFCTNVKTKLQKIILNAINLYGVGNYQKNSYHENDVSLLLYFSALESLLINNMQNNIRKRLSTLIPILLFTKNIQRRSSEVINEAYLRRNDFVHSGKSISKTSRVGTTNEIHNLVEKSLAVLITEVVDKRIYKHELNMWFEKLNKIYSENQCLFFE